MILMRSNRIRPQQKFNKRKKRFPISSHIRCESETRFLFGIVLQSLFLSDQFNGFFAADLFDFKFKDL